MVTLNEVCEFYQLNPNQLREPHVSVFLEDFNIRLDEEGSGLNKKISSSTIRSLLCLLGLSYQPKVITIAALKGGIGKTFLSTHIAVRASMMGLRVLLIDLDPEACATNSLLTESDVHQTQKKMTILEILKFSEEVKNAIIPSRYDGLDLIPSALKVTKAEKIVNGKNPKTLLKRLLTNLPYDLIFFELPPSFSTLSSAAYLASDTILIPCTPNIHSLESVDLTIEAVKEVSLEFECQNVEFKVLMNMFNPKRNASQDVLQILQEDYPDLILPFQIHESADILNAINAGLTIFESRCSPKIRQEINQLLAILWTPSPAKVVELSESFHHPLLSSLGTTETSSLTH